MRVHINIAIALLAVASWVGAAEPQATPSPPATQVKSDAGPVPFATLNPPPGITPAMSRGAFPQSLPKNAAPLPKRTWTAEQRKNYEKRVEWFHDAKYGIAFEFNPRMARGPVKGIGESWQEWDSDKWNAWIDAVDVEKVADQAKEIGAGYVILSIGQLHQYSCAPNPVLEKLWKVKPGQFTARRDLPIDLCNALENRGIPMMLYIVGDGFGVPLPDGVSKEQAAVNWLAVCQWYSDHYGKRCKGWWVDGLNESIKDYRVRIFEALRHGNPDALVTSGTYELSDFLHGHQFPWDWNKQRRVAKPFFGRWDPDFNIQYHAFISVGQVWAASDTPKKTADLVGYSSDVVKGGGVITFDIGGFENVKGKMVYPFLQIPTAQFEQLKAVRDALKNISPSAGDGRKANEEKLPR